MNIEKTSNLKMDSINLKDYFLKEKINVIFYDKVTFSTENLKKEDILIIEDNFSSGYLHKLINQIKHDVPSATVILLLNKPKDDDIIYYLELGFDECFPKSLSPKLLLTKIKSIHRRNYFSAIPGKVRRQKVILSQKYGLRLDPDNRAVISQGKEIFFTKIEFEILKFLMENSGIIVSRDLIVNKVKTLSSDSFERTIDTQIYRIRQKIRHFDNLNNLITTIRGIGYIFSER
jgi:DNA-binding response OmpR family regulator